MRRRNALTPAQKEALLSWLTAGYPDGAIQRWFRENDWPEISAQTISYHRISHREEIEAARAARVAGALNEGLAIKENRVRALLRHADALEQILWEPDEKGRIVNEKAYRETLDDIAREMGHRRTGVDVNLSTLSDEELVTLATQVLKPAAAGGAVGDGPPRPDPATEAGE